MSGRTLSGSIPHHESTTASGAAEVTSSSVIGVLLQSRSDHEFVAPIAAIMSDTHERLPGTITGFGHHSTRMD